LVLMVITLLRIAWVNHLADQGFFSKYTEIAHAILSGHLPVDRLGDLSTGYLWSIVLVQGPLGMDALGIRTLQIVGVSLAAALCGAVAWKRWGFPSGLAATLVLLTSRAALVNATELEPETLILCLVTLGLCLVISSDRPSLRFFAGCALGLAVITRPSVALPAVLMIGAMMLPKGSAKQRLLRIVPLIIGVAVPVVVSHIAISRLTGGLVTPMNPGTVLFEGWNPLATGYEGEAPIVVKDIEQTLGLPDGLHVAYRLVAARATNTPISSVVSNGYWSKKALAFVRHEPGAAMTLMLRKALLVFRSYDAWDLKTLDRKSTLLGSVPFVPFGLAAALAAVGLFFGWRSLSTWALGLWVFGGWSVMVLFYVTARQRNVLLPAIALLSAIAIDGLVSAWRHDQRWKVTITLILSVLVAIALSLQGSPQREDHHGWQLLAAQEATAGKAGQTQNSSDVMTWSARCATYLDPWALQEADPRIINREIQAQLKQAQPPERYFDLALVMIEIGRTAEAERLLQTLGDARYRPRRGARWCSSIAYHRARCRAIAGDLPDAQALVLRALKQAPGDPRVLGLNAVLSEISGARIESQAARQLLDALFDPFTATHALAQAYSDCGQSSTATALLNEVRNTLPEWNTSLKR
jgi:hypothetical protein